MKFVRPHCYFVPLAISWMSSKIVLSVAPSTFVLTKIVLYTQLTVQKDTRYCQDMS